MKWSYKAIHYDPDVETYTPEEKLKLSGSELSHALGSALGPPAIEGDLNALGQDGWELVAVVPGKISDDGRPWLAILKRPANTSGQRSRNPND